MSDPYRNQPKCEHGNLTHMACRSCMEKRSPMQKLRAELETAKTELADVKAERDALQARIDGADKVFVIKEKTTTKYWEIDGTKVGSDAMYKQYLLMDPRAYEQITALILRDESEG